MLLELGAAIQSAQALGDLIKGAVGARDDKLLRERTTQLLTALLEIQQAALASNAERLRLQEEVENLQAELGKLLQWDKEAARYTLASPAPDKFAYKLLPDKANDEPEHWACPVCFGNARKSIMQTIMRAGVHEPRTLLYCPACRLEIRIK
jgi:hypothetical protein